MSASPLHDKTPNTYNLSRKRLILDYVDPYGGSWNASSHLESINQAKVFSGPPPTNGEELDMSHRRNFNQKLESWEGMSPTKSDLSVSLASFGEPDGSTPKSKHEARKESPRVVGDLLPSSLPPSSPPSLGDRLDIVPREDDAKNNEPDPFGFLAMEQILKARKRQAPTLNRSRVLNRGPGRGSLIGEHGGAEETASSSARAGNEMHQQRQSIPNGQKRTPDRLPSTSSRPAESQPSSPCRGFTRRKPENRKENCGKHKARKGGEDELEDGQPQAKTSFKQDITISKRPRKRFRRQGQLKGDKRNTSRKASEVKAKLAPDPLDVEERKELEKHKREERIRYYQRLDSYHLAKEKVWIV